MFNTYINYPELMNEGTWGEDTVILNNDINLLKNTNFNDTGYSLVDHNYNSLAQNFIKSEILKKTNKEFELEKYHTHISEEEHTVLLNSMPFKRNTNSEIEEFSTYLENKVSNTLKEKVKIFNGDLWFRICRPTSLYKNDFNPCHRDIYLDFYRNTANIYLPVAGSNELSSLNIHSGSHTWNENVTYRTVGGAYFKSTQKKYSVDAIIASKQPLNMIRPNPSETQFMLFSPYLIHGCANNDNLDTTRISLEVRFIRDTEMKQEEYFNNFLKKRTGR